MIAIVIVRALPTQVESAAESTSGVLRWRMVWLKRAQVARRLGRSIATVRRLEEEGSLLPRHGPGKVRLFNSQDVDQMAQRAAQAGHVLSQTAFDSERRSVRPIATGTRSPGTAPDQQRHHDINPDYQRLAASHSAMREELLELLEQLIELRPSPRAIGVLEDMLAVLGTHEDEPPLD